MWDVTSHHSAYKENSINPAISRVSPINILLAFPPVVLEVESDPTGSYFRTIMANHDRAHIEETALLPVTSRAFPLKNLPNGSVLD